MTEKWEGMGSFQYSGHIAFRRREIKPLSCQGKTELTF